MEKVRFTIRYWGRVLSTANEIAWKKSIMKEATIALLSALAILIVLLLLSIGGILPENWKILIGDFSAEVRTNLLYFTGALVHE